MASLQDFPTVRNFLSNGRKSNVTALHKFIFQFEGDRSNRKRLRAFKGFDFDSHDDNYQILLAYVRNNLTDADLTSICIMLGIDSNVEEKCLHIFNNLRINHLLEGGEQHIEDETDDEDEDELVAAAPVEVGRERKNTQEAGRSQQVLQQVHRAASPDEELSQYGDASSRIRSETNHRPVSRFALNFRDIEDSVRVYDGSGSISIESWIEEFEETASIMEWDNFQKFIFAKRMLKGIASLFVKSERGIISWEKLKRILLDEFQTKTNSAEIHKQLSSRKMGKDEILQEYYLKMKELAARGRVENDALIQYVIDGIDDLSINKAVLYGASNLKDFKEKLKTYELIRKRSAKPAEAKKPAESRYLNQAKCIAQTSRQQQQQWSCFNCGVKGHRSGDCPMKEKGTKCFKCNQFGHLAKNCAKENPDNKSNTRILKVADEKMTKNVKIGSFDYEALFDTGCKFNIMTSDVYDVLNKPKLTQTQIRLVGFGEKKPEDDIKPIGALTTDIEVDNNVYNENFLVVPTKYLDVQMILGSEFCVDKEVKIDKSGIHFEKISNSFDDDVTAVMMINAADGGEINIDSSVSESVRQEVIELVNNYQPNQTKSANVEMRIVLADDTPIFSRPHRLPLTERHIVDEQIEKWLAEGIIEHSDSEFCSPVVLVKKRDGTPRLCVDYRKINKVIIKDRFPLPLIEDQLDRLQGAMMFSTIDLKNGFFHVAVTEQSRKYTSFVTHSGQFQFKRVPFGLCNSPSIFQRYINAIFRDLTKEGIALPYIDDIIIPAVDEKEALINLSKVLNICREYGLQLNIKKCQFLQKCVEFLGHVIENKKISPSPRKIEALINYKAPQTIKQVQSFLGLASYFRKFIPNFSRIAKPLSDLLKQGSKFKFEHEQICSFNALKQSLCEKPVLSIFQQGLDTEVHTDASADGFGAVLLQKSNEDGQLHPVYFMSHKTNDAERKYSSYELEILAVVAALKRFRVYLLGQHFKLITDCNALVKTLEKKDLCARVARWVLLLSEYDYVVEHRTGTRLKHADALSRYAVLSITEEDVLVKIRRAQTRDEDIKAIIDILRVKPNHQNYFLKGNILYKLHNDNELIVVPKAMQREVIKKAHERGHFGLQKVKDLLDKDFYIPNMKEKIEKHIAYCIPCIVVNRKSGKQEGHLHPLNKGETPLSTYHIDYIGPLESTSKMYKHILVVVDAFTKFCWLYPTKTTSAACTIAKLKIQSVAFGNPETIITDRGSAFTSEDFREFCEHEGIKHIKVTTGLPRANGQVERINGVVSTVLAKLAVNEPSKWYKYVEAVQQNINSTFSRSIKTTPFELLTGVKMRLKTDLTIKQLIEDAFIENFNEEREILRKVAKEQILKTQEANKRCYNKHRKPPKLYQVGDLVAIKRTQLGGGLKLKAKYLGPYQVVKVKSNDTYDVLRVGGDEGPRQTSSCAEYMKPWMDCDYDEDEVAGFEANQ